MNWWQYFKPRSDPPGQDVTTALDSSQAVHPVDASVVITGKNIAWSANPINCLRPLASDLNATRRGRAITTR